MRKNTSIYNQLRCIVLCCLVCSNYNHALHCTGFSAFVCIVVKCLCVYLCAGWACINTFLIKRQNNCLLLSCCLCLFLWANEKKRKLYRRTFSLLLLLFLLMLLLLLIFGLDGGRTYISLIFLHFSLAFSNFVLFCFHSFYYLCVSYIPFEWINQDEIEIRRAKSISHNFIYFNKYINFKSVIVRWQL